MQRRQFLEAAAALSGLPASDESSDADDSCDDDAPDYDRTTVVTTSGGLEVWTKPDTETSVRVAAHPEGTGLILSNEIGQMNVLLLPEDVELLCQELRDAKMKTQPDEVEQSREWVTADYRDEGNSTDERRRRYRS